MQLKLLQRGENLRCLSSPWSISFGSSEYDILGQTLLRLESAELKLKQKNTAAREISRSIADLNAKLVMVEQLHAKGYLKDEVHKAQVQEINDQLRRLKRERQCEFSSGITHMIEELTRLKKTAGRVRGTPGPLR